ncbi:hypothetical protein ACQ4PT_015757 [Festuca glaucescens]
MWIHVTKLRDLNGAGWDEETHTILLEDENYIGHVPAHPKDAEFLNKPITNYSQMQQIFAFGLATEKYAMGSSEPLGTPSPDKQDTQDSDTVVIDDDYQPPPSPGPDTSAAPRPGSADVAKKRNRSVFADEDVGHMAFMTEAVKAVEVAITIPSRHAP